MNEELVAAIAASLVSSRPLGGKKHFQKLFYLIQKSQVPTDLDFEMHYYGPYSFALAAEMSRLERDDVLRVTEGRITSGEQTSQVLKELSDELRPYRSQIKVVLDAFREKTPKHLELVATAHLASERLTQLGKSTNAAAVIATVRSEKGAKFSEGDISNAIAELRDVGLLQRVD